MILWIYSRPFSVQRLKRWWSGQPELPARKRPEPAAAAPPAEPATEV
jgi:hypothetical protein